MPPIRLAGLAALVRTLASPTAKLAGLWGLVTMWLASDGADAIFPDGAIQLCGAALVVLFAVVALVVGIVRRRRGDLHAVQRSLVAAGAAAVTIVLVVAALGFDLPLRARLALSGPALARYGDRMATDSTLRQARWVGLFHVDEILRTERSTHFITGGCGFIDQCGIVYSPQGPPPQVSRQRYEPLWGPWWHTQLHF